MWVSHLTQKGGGPHFAGVQYQRGGGFGSVFRGLMRFILPIAKTAGRSLGKQAIKAGSRIATDVIDGRNIRESAEEHSTKAIKNLGARARKATGRRPRKRQIGRGLGNRQRPKRINTRTVTSRNIAKGVIRKDDFGVHFARNNEAY